MVIRKAYRFRLRPSEAQESLFRQYAGCRRLAWNKALDLQKKRLGREERTLGYSRLCSVLLGWKQEHPFLAEPPSQALQQVLMDLDRAILDQGWGEFQRQVGYKLEWAGGELRLINPAYTSQECSVCHHVSPENRKTRDKFQCVACGHTEDADINAAKNIKAAGLAVSACGGLGASRPPVKQEPSCRKERCHAA